MESTVCHAFRIGAQDELGETEKRLLVIAEDWCGDAANTIPVLAKWAEQVEGLELRIIPRDEHPQVMDRYLTDGSRSLNRHRSGCGWEPGGHLGAAPRRTPDFCYGQQDARE